MQKNLHMVKSEGVQMKKLVSTILAAAMIMGLPAGCAKKAEVTYEPTVTVEPTAAAASSDVPQNTTVKESGNAIFQIANAQSGTSSMTDEELKKAYSQFVFGVMKRCVQEAKGENVLISADSILFALDMTAAGASGTTLDQMMNTMVPGADNASAFRFGVERMDSLQNDTLKIANSVWFNKTRASVVKDDFLDYVEKHFDAKATAIEFGPTVVDAVNKWVEEKTNGRIKDLLKEVDPDSLMVLVNAIAFDGKWKEGYNEGQVWDAYFTNSSGEEKEVKFLSGTEDTYLSSEKATGFMKDYDDGKYAFMTILPKDITVDINEFIAEMTPEEYWAFWENRQTSGIVHTMMPEFKTEYSVELPKTLIDMGMTDAFDAGKADFSNMVDTNVYISQVIHKTYIDVNRDGTQAAAATAVVMNEAAVEYDPNEHTVICNRPFAYAIVDKATGLPVFLGTVEKV